MRFGIAIALGLVLSGCITASFKRDLVESRARFDLACQGVSVAPLGSDTFGASGCGQKSTYIVVCDGGAARRDLCNAMANNTTATAASR